MDTVMWNPVSRKEFYIPNQGDLGGWRQVARSQLQEKLSVLVHVTAGQPVRATELLAQSSTSEHSNAVIVFVAHYHRGLYASNDVKNICRYLPTASQ